ncbi:hypothetical protein HI914_05384 [Erysiphe necator]|nr:hypothetical protein HI914_05384 [Erysiphe necator]
MSTSTTLLPDFAFLCTICWQYQPRGIKPKILGQSARIVCEKCWCAVIDLSICWVCGDIVVRGDEIVSLGWCFWHISCFGCLVCGTQITLPKNENKSKIGSEKFMGNFNGSSSKGVELESVPLCHVCEIEMDGEENRQILERGLLTVSLFDGGLSRQRFEYLETGRDQSSTIVSSRRRKLKFKPITSSSSEDINTQLSSETGADGIIPLLDNAAQMSFSDAGDSNDIDQDILEGSNYSTSESDADTMASSIYLSIFDPISDLAFIPSSTKPLPRWMNIFPKNLGAIPERKTHFVPSKISLNSEEAEIFFPGNGNDSNNTVITDEISSLLPLKVTGAKEKNNTYLKDSKNDPKKTSYARSLNILSLDSQRIKSTARSNHRSLSFDSIYLTPPEFLSCDLLSPV